MSHLEALPDELLARVLHGLGPVRLCAAAVASRRLELLATSGLLWREQLWRLFVFGLSPFLHAIRRFDATEVGDRRWRALRTFGSSSRASIHLQ